MTYLEETYYHRLNPGQGFGIQRVYTEDGSLDETMAVQSHDVVLVPQGPSSLRRALWLRDVLPERHGRPDPQVAVSRTTRTMTGFTGATTLSLEAARAAPCHQRRSRRRR